MLNETPGTPSSSADRTAPAPSEGGSEGAGAVLATIGDRNDGEPSGAAAGTGATDSVLAGLPLQLDVTVPVPSFRIEDLMALEKGTVFESGWPHTEDVPVWCGGAQLAWTEFEVVDDKLAVRVTRIS